MHEIQLLNDKLDLLLKRYGALHAENKRLKDTVASQTKSIESLNLKLHEVEQNMVAVQIGKSVLTEDEKVKMRQQIDTVIGEIDKILTNLND
jgi:hypothetical protein